MKYILSSLLLSLLSFQSFSQNVEWQHFQQTELIYQIVPDGHILWIRTNNGLVRFNTITHAYQTFDKTNSGLPDNSIISIFVDHTHSLWVSTNQRGIAKFDGTNWTQFDPSTVPWTRYGVSAFAEDSANRLWVFGGNFAARQEGNSWNFIYDKIDYVTAVTKDHHGRLWCAAGNNLYEIVDTTVTFHHYLLYSRFYSVAVDSSDNVWSATSYGLAKFDGKSFTIYNQQNSKIPSAGITNSWVDNKNVVWVSQESEWGTNCNPCRGGVTSFDGTKFMKYDSSNSDLTIHRCSALCTDSANNLWVGDLGSGKIYQLDKEGSVSSYNISNPAYPYAIVRYMAKDSAGNVYVLSSPLATNLPNMLTKYNSSAWQVVANNLHGNNVMTCDTKNNLYLLADTILLKYDGLTWTSIPLPSFWFHKNTSYCLNLKCDLLNHLWMDAIDTINTNPNSLWLFKRILTEYDGTNWHYFDRNNSGNMDTLLYEIKIDTHNNLWLLGRNLVKYDSHTWQTILTGSQLHSDTTSASHFAIDNNNNVWIADNNSGFTRYSSGSFQHFPNPDWYDCNATFSNIDAAPDGSIWGLSPSPTHMDENSVSSWHYKNSPLSTFNGISKIVIDKYGNKIFGGTGVYIYHEGGIVTSADNNSTTSQNTKVDIYPNPAHEKTTITLNGNANGEVTVLNLVGVTLFHDNVVINGQTNYRLDVSRYPAGFYLIEVKTAAGKTVSKFIRQ